MKQKEGAEVMIYQNVAYEKVWYGEYVVKHYLAKELENYKCEHILIVTTASLVDTRSYMLLLDVCSSYSTFVWKAKQHAPLESILENFVKIQNFNPDLIISFGGGSTIDSAKLLAFMLAHQIKTEAEIMSYSLDKQKTLQIQTPLVPHFTIPTTLSAAEFSSTAGFSINISDSTRQKYGLTNRNMTPVQIYLDSSFTVETPIDFWISTGIRGLDHAFETVYSPKESLVNEVLALEALNLLFKYLPLSKDDPSCREYRLKCQLGSWLSFYSNNNIRVGLSHMIGHQLGAFYSIPHGMTSAIVLPHVLEFMSNYSVEKLASIYDSLQVEAKTKVRGLDKQEKAKEVANLFRELLTDLNVNKLLRDFNVKKESLPLVTKNVLSEVKMKDNSFLKSLPNLEEHISEILANAW